MWVVFDVLWSLWSGVSINSYMSVCIICAALNNTVGSKGNMSQERDPNTIFIGRKPPMNYVMAVITCFNSNNAKAVTLKARGQAISTAVDVAEVVRRKFLKDVQVDQIAIGTEEITPQEGGNPRKVSTMEITLKM